jgi:hypothetical protein
MNEVGFAQLPVRVGLVERLSALHSVCWQNLPLRTFAKPTHTSLPLEGVNLKQG